MSKKFKLKKSDYDITDNEIKVKSNTYEDNRPDTFTAEHEQAVDDYRTDFIAGSLTGASSLSTKLMKDHNRVIVSGGLTDGHSFRAVVDKETGEGDDVIYGNSVVTIRTPYSNARRKGGSIRAAMNYMQDVCEQEFGEQ